MLSRKVIIKSVNDALAEKFPIIPSLSRDVREGFSRPSFKVTLETIGESATVNLTEREMSCRILYFPTNQYDYDEETAEMQDDLSILFGLKFDAGSHTIPISDSNTDMIDGVLEYNFRFDFVDDAVVTDPTAPNMEELDYRG